MTESSTPSKLAKWKRPLIGGVLSVLFTVPVIGWVTVSLVGEDVGGLILLVFLGPPAFILQILYLEGAWWDNSIQLITVATGFWFIVGAIIAYLIKSNKNAIFLWLLVFILQIVLTIWLFFSGGGGMG